MHQFSHAYSRTCAFLNKCINSRYIYIYTYIYRAHFNLWIYEPSLAIRTILENEMYGSINSYLKILSFSCFSGDHSCPPLLLYIAATLPQLLFAITLGQIMVMGNGQITSYHKTYGSLCTFIYSHSAFRPFSLP